MKTNFDDILKRKLEQQHFPVDQTHRQEMIDLLNSQRRRKPLPFWWLGGMVSLVAIAGLYFYTAEINIKSNQSEPVNIQKEIASPAENEVMAAANEEEYGSSADKQVERTITTNDLSTNASATSKFPDAAQNNQLHNKSKVKPSAKDVDSGKLLIADSKKVASTNQNVLPVSSSAQGNELSDGVMNQISPSNDQTRLDKMVSNDFLDNERADEPMTLRTLESILALEDLEMTGISYALENTSIQIQPAAAYKKSFYVFGETGLGFIIGSKPDFEAGWKFHLGAGLGFSFSPKLQFTLSGGYLFQNGGFDFQRLSSVNKPGFGTRSSFNTLTPDKLHFVYSKVGVQTRTHRHIFAAHTGMQLLYGAQGDITTIVEDQFFGNKQLNEYTWLKTSGLRTLHWTADISYGYQITPHLSVTAGADYYFSSLTVEDTSLKSEGFTWSGAYSPFQPFINLNYLLYGRL